MKKKTKILFDKYNLNCSRDKGFTTLSDNLGMAQGKKEL